MKKSGTSRAQRAAVRLCVCASLLQSHAFAQATAADKAAAEALFEQGIDLMKTGKYAEACAKLEQSMGVERGIGTSLYLAECYEKMGRTASAWGLFRDAASEAQARGEAERAQQGRTRAARLEPRLSRLSIVVPAERPAGLQVFRDNDQVPEALWNVQVPVDPGDHRITARAPGYTEWSQVVHVEGDAANLSAAVPPLERDASAPVAPTTSNVLAPTDTAPVSEPKAGDTQRTIGIITTAVGAVGLGVGGFFGIRAIGKNSDAKDHCDGTVCRDRAGQDLTDDAKSAATLANVFVIGGAVLVAGGLTLYFTAPSGQERSVAVASDGRGGTHLVVGGSF